MGRHSGTRVAIIRRDAARNPMVAHCDRSKMHQRPMQSVRARRGWSEETLEGQCLHNPCQCFQNLCRMVTTASPAPNGWRPRGWAAQRQTFSLISSRRRGAGGVTSYERDLAVTATFHSAHSVKNAIFRNILLFVEFKLLSLSFY